jgi:circadian clock protein KaiC
LFVRIGAAIDAIGARRVVVDTLEALFLGFENERILRAELRRLFRWLKDRGVTAIITAEQGDGRMTRHGLEEYVSDCVIQLDHRVFERISTRHLRVVKYRGSFHGTNEYPFLIDERGISVLPVTSVGLDHPAVLERISTGIPRLDTMFGGGFYRGSSILVTGTAGTGKTSLAAHFALAACQRGERALFLAFEESPDQIIRNMRSIGIDLEPSVQSGLLRMHAGRTSLYGLEMHLVTAQHLVEEFKPDVVILDPISNLLAVGTPSEVKVALMRLIDFFKSSEITAYFTGLTPSRSEIEQTDLDISSLLDTWILLRDFESNGERNRGLHVLKSRGMAHSNQVREFLLTDNGVELLDVYVGPSGMLMGTARLAMEAREEAEERERRRDIEETLQQIAHQHETLDRQIATLRAQFEADSQGLRAGLAHEKLQEAARERDRERMGELRKADLVNQSDSGESV